MMRMSLGLVLEKTGREKTTACGNPCDVLAGFILFLSSLLRYTFYYSKL
jgi:hypothetical protein